jgi:hypothetical protein
MRYETILGRRKVRRGRQTWQIGKTVLIGGRACLALFAGLWHDNKEAAK